LLRPWADDDCFRLDQNREDGEHGKIDRSERPNGSLTDPARDHPAGVSSDTSPGDSLSGKAA
jgi:hypothetical protein